MDLAFSSSQKPFRARESSLVMFGEFRYFQPQNHVTSSAAFPLTPTPLVTHDPLTHLPPKQGDAPEPSEGKLTSVWFGFLFNFGLSFFFPPPSASLEVQRMSPAMGVQVSAHHPPASSGSPRPATPSPRPPEARPSPPSPGSPRPRVPAAASPLSGEGNGERPRAPRALASPHPAVAAAAPSGPSRELT